MDQSLRSALGEKENKGTVSVLGSSTGVLREEPTCQLIIILPQT